MPITDDVRKVGGTVLDEARKPWYAAVGAGELAYGQLQTQLTQLPTEVQARLRKLQSGADPAAVRAAVETATAQGLRTYGFYAQQARETYESLAHRGELVVRRLRRSPEVRSAFDAVEDVVDGAGETVAKTEAAVTEPGPTTTRATRKPAAGRAATKTVPARKTTNSKKN
jgi:hypothetical protein